MMGDIEIPTAGSDEHFWWTIIDRIAAQFEDTWNSPLWILPDGRHVAAAQRALLLKSKSGALATGNLHTLLSIAAWILNLPLLDVTVRPTTAILTIEELLTEQLPDAYRHSANSPGFAASFWNALEELESRGFFPTEILPGYQGKPPPKPFINLQQRLHRAWEQRGYYTAGEILRRARHQLLRSGARPQLPDMIFIGPFFNPTEIERAFIRVLEDLSSRVVLLPASGSDWVEATKMSPPEASLSSLYPRQPEEELEVVFTDIALRVAAGEKRYRDFRIICPLLSDRLPRLESTARAFGVPLKGQISRSLAVFPPALLLLRLLDLFQNRWQRRDVLEILRSRLIRAPLDQIHEAIRWGLKNGSTPTSSAGHYWVDELSKIEVPDVVASLKRLLDLDLQSVDLRRGSDFASWIVSCMTFIKEAILSDKSDVAEEYNNVDDTRGWEVLDSLGAGFQLHFRRDTTRVALFSAFRKALSMCRYEQKEAIYDAVEICPTYREDHLPVPVIIYIGLNSRVPSPRRGSPFFPEEETSRYNEQWRLFQLQLLNAEEEILLSCPEYDDEGTKLAVSPFIQSLQNEWDANLIEKEIISLPRHALLGATRRPITPQNQQQDTRLTRASLLPILALKSRKWSVTELDCAIQCPYLHFAQHILRLEYPVDPLEEGVTPRLLGYLAHEALKRYFNPEKPRHSFDIERWVREEFAKMTAVFNPHPETDRALEELVSCLKEFTAVADNGLLVDFEPQKCEHKLEHPSEQNGWVLDEFSEPVVLRGRIDRFDRDAGGRVVVIDYKYAKSSSLTERQAEISTGTAPQLPLYAYYLQKAEDRNVVGIMEVYLRSRNFCALIPDGPDRIPETLKKGSKAFPLDVEGRSMLFSKALQQLQQQMENVAAGLIPPKPRDPDRCGPGHCDYADLCRYRRRWMRMRGTP